MLVRTFGLPGQGPTTLRQERRRCPGGPSTWEAAAAPRNSSRTAVKATVNPPPILRASTRAQAQSPRNADDSLPDDDDFMRPERERYLHRRGQERPACPTRARRSPRSRRLREPNGARGSFIFWWARRDRTTLPSTAWYASKSRDLPLPWAGLGPRCPQSHAEFAGVRLRRARPLLLAPVVLVVGRRYGSAPGPRAVPQVDRTTYADFFLDPPPPRNLAGACVVSERGKRDSSISGERRQPEGVNCAAARALRGGGQSAVHRARQGCADH